VSVFERLQLRADNRHPRSHSQVQDKRRDYRSKGLEAKMLQIADIGVARGERAMLTTLVQDVRHALRQLRKIPGFTAAAVLTLALGIGANAAIFRLVNAVLLKNLPVADPKTMVYLGGNDNCCVGHGIPDGGDSTVFSTNSNQHLRKNTQEFKDLATIQAGFAFRPVIARRDGTQERARSVMGEFVSGNYFRMFGLQPQAGRLVADADDVEGAPIVAVMSYETWKNDYAADISVVGSTFWINTKPVTIVGIAPKGFYGDRLSSTPPDFYLCIESMPVLANAPYVHDADAMWLHMSGRVKPGVATTTVAGQAERTVAASART
jgi:macrolide transport system ATP-binding/permease protein